MPKIKEIAVTLACGVVTRTVTPEELATELELSTVRPALLALLLRRSGPQPVPAAGSPSGEPTEGALSHNSCIKFLIMVLPCSVRIASG